MKIERRFVYVFGTAIAGILLIVFIWRQTEPAKGDHGNEVRRTVAILQRKEEPVASSGSAGTGAPSTTEKDPRRIRWEDRNRKDSDSFLEYLSKLQALNGASVAVHGLVLDEAGSPVPEAAVNWSVPGAASWVENKSGKLTAGPAGRFFLSGVKGPQIYLSVQKEGYRTVSHSRGTWFADVPSSEAHPLVLHLKTNPLSHDHVRMEVQHPMPLDGKPVTFPLDRRKAGAESTRRLTLTCTGSPVPGQPFAWSAAISVEGGGLVPADRSVEQLEAPPEGYSTGMKMKSGNTGPGWHAEGTQTYFAKFPDGTYGRVEVWVRPRFGVVQVTSLINTSGSRSLDPGVEALPAPE